MLGSLEESQETLRDRCGADEILARATADEGLSARVGGRWRKGLKKRVDVGWAEDWGLRDR